MRIPMMAPPCLGNNFVVIAFLGVNGNYDLDKGEPAGKYANNPFALMRNTSGVEIKLLFRYTAAVIDNLICEARV